MSAYQFGPPPPPPSSGPRKPEEFYAYPPNPPYASAPPAHRGGYGHAGGSGGRAGHYQASGGHVSEHSRHNKEHVPNYTDRSFGSSYTAPQQQSSYWQGNAPVPRHPSAAPSAPYPPNGYAFQGYQQPQPPQEYGYSGQPPQQSYPPAYAQHQQQHDYQSQQWGRGGYQGDRGGHKPDHAMGPPIRIGFDRPGGPTPHASNGYGQQYPPSHHQPQSFPQPPTYGSQPPVPVNAPLPPPPQFSGHSANRGHYGSGGRGQGRGNFGHFNKGRSFNNNNAGGEKFRHQNQRPHHATSSPASHKADQGFKKKKRKTNTLGLTPGDGDDSDVPADEETYWVQKLGNEIPT